MSVVLEHTTMRQGPLYQLLAKNVRLENIQPVTVDRQFLIALSVLLVVIKALRQHFIAIIVVQEDIIT
jgi:hypothetical protein